jgi:hypothetical protein
MREQIFGDRKLVAVGVCIDPRQLDRLRSWGDRRGMNLSSITRKALDAFERSVGLVDQDADRK